ncbi:DUF4259 domain-containing protein [Paenibacillus frigoriresistens]|uniref:DUF4259 domain-containing protein n=1 Tax=Paenibacillus alginolyticus TaxID=59839 RepID=UPI001565096E|nr:DUF4259 domain-containing protein [Paenibacillus frigoriresistens]NRF90879.1 DUF4259 domain-containing protein [Paenibacillus frigoriresistens]
MGAWGFGNLENDTVLDWVVDLLETEDLSLITESIAMVLEDDYLDADTAAIAIGAIEILAALQNRPGKEEFDDKLNEWIKEHKEKGTNLLVTAQKALEKILLESELKDLWEETEEYENWVKTIKELEERTLL